MPKRSKNSKKRIPQLSYTDNRNVGWFVSYRDPITGVPKKQRFGMGLSEKEANEKYNDWLAGHLRGEVSTVKTKSDNIAGIIKPAKMTTANTVKGSLIEIASDMLKFDESRIRKENEAKRKGTIKLKEYNSIYKLTHFFLQFINKLHGKGAVGRMTLADLKMADIEAYNLSLVETGYSNSQVKKRIQVVKSIINRASKADLGQQLLSWNWDARDVHHGKPDKEVLLPKVKHLKLILAKTNEQRTAMIWMAIGLGFGQSDLARARVRHFDKDSYDMRRGKTGIDRYGKMPPRVWKAISEYLLVCPRKDDDLLFETEDGKPLVHGNTDSVALWWAFTRDNLKDADGNPANDGLNGFYSLRHTGATEFGSRDGTSLAAMRGWLGHSMSSTVADRYMRPVAPEHKDLVDWVRECLHTTGRLK